MSSATLQADPTPDREAQLAATFRLLFERCADAILLFDAKTAQVIDCNAAAVAMMRDVSKETLLERGPWAISPEFQPDGEPSAEKSVKILAEVMEHGSAHFEWTHLRADGTEAPTEVSLTLVELGTRPLLIGIGREIAERQKAATALRELNASLELRVAERTSALEEANAQLQAAEQGLLKTLQKEKKLGELKSNFVSLVSHEFRTPLGVITSAADVLDRYFDRLSPERRRKHLDMIFRATKSLAQLVDSVLLLGRVESGRLMFSPVPVELGSLCFQLVDEILSATGNRCPIECAVAPGLEIARSDPDLLRHILMNLLSNAVKYSEPSAPVRLEVGRRGHLAVCTVRDRGIGIPERDRKHLFKSFARGRNVGQRPGSGLGLLIVKRCLDLHGGIVHVESEVGKGTTITVGLPVFPPDGAELLPPSLL